MPSQPPPLPDDPRSSRRATAVRAVLVAACLALAALGVAVLVAGPGAPVVPAGREPQPAPGPVAGSDPLAVAPGSPPVAAGARTEVGAPDPVAIPARLDRATLVLGRCTDTERRPLAGAELALIDPVSGEEVTAAASGALLPRPAPTAADGCFAAAAPAGLAFELRVRRSGHATTICEVGSLQHGQQVDLGDVRLARGCRVAATVVDTDGVPQAGLVVELRHDPTPRFRGPVRPLRATRAISDAGGGVQLPDLLHAGSWRVWIEDRGSVEPARVAIAEGGGAALFEFRVPALDPSRAIAGRVVDQYGEPVAGAVLLARATADGNVVKAVSRIDGSFRLDQERGRPAVGTVHLRARAAGCEDLEDDRQWRWGTTDAELRLTRGGVLTVSVVGPAGEPVEDFALHVFAPHSTELRDLRARSRGYHPGGVAHARGLEPGEQLVFVDPADPRFAAPGFVRATLSGATGGCQVVVDYRHWHGLRVVDAARQPVAGATVELLLPLTGQRPTVATPAASLLDLVWSGGRRRAVRERIELTDHRGRVRIDGHPALSYWLRVSAPGHVPALEPVSLAGAPDPLEVVLQRGARVELSLLPAGFADQIREVASGWPELSLRREEDGELIVHGSRPRPRDAVGPFVFDAVPPGTWQLEASWKNRARRHGGRDVHRLTEVRDLAEGEVRRLALPVGHLLHARIRGRIEIDGEPGAGAVRLARAEDLGQPPYEVEARVSRDGRFEVLVPAGRWHCAVRRSDDKRAGWVLAPPGVAVASGQVVDALFAVRPVAVRIVLRDRAGKPLVGARLQICCGDQPAPEPISTDGDGVAATWLTVGSHHVALLRPVGEPVALGPIKISLATEVIELRVD